MAPNDRNKKELTFDDVSAQLKLEFVVEGCRRQASEILAMTKKKDPPSKRELTEIAGRLVMAVAVASGVDVPDGEETKSTNKIIQDARDLLINLQKEKNDGKFDED